MSRTLAGEIGISGMLVARPREDYIPLDERLTDMRP